MKSTEDDGKVRGDISQLAKKDRQAIERAVIVLTVAEQQKKEIEASIKDAKATIYASLQSKGLDACDLSDGGSVAGWVGRSVSYPADRVKDYLVKHGVKAAVVANAWESAKKESEWTTAAYYPPKVANGGKAEE